LSNNMFRSRDAVLVGVSGGPDSMALLYILNTLATEFSLDLGVAHLNHCLREDASERDAAFVDSVALKLNLPIYAEKVDILKYGKEKCLSVEEAGREIRYAFFDKVSDTHGYDRIALGHHCDDNAELVLMFLLRGSGPLGISGIPPVRDERIIRPLIDLTRSEIMNYLTARNISFVSDHSNTENRYLRNRVRHQLIPALKASYNPNTVETINRLSRIVRDEDRWADEIMEPILENAFLAKSEGCLVLAIDILKGLHIAAKRRLIRKAISRVKGDLRRITFLHIEAVVDLLNADPSERTLFLHLPRQILVRRDRGKLTISRAKVSLRSLEKKSDRHAIPDFEYTVAGPGSIFIEEIDARISFSEMAIENVPTPYTLEKQIAFFDIHTLNYPLTVRNFRPGDRFQPLGMSGSKKVKKFYIDKKINRRQRAETPVLLSRGKIIWIAGHRIAETVKVTAETAKVLKAELFLA